MATFSTPSNALSCDELAQDTVLLGQNRLRHAQQYADADECRQFRHDRPEVVRLARDKHRFEQPLDDEELNDEADRYRELKGGCEEQFAPPGFGNEAERIGDEARELS